MQFDRGAKRLKISEDFTEEDRRLRLGDILTALMAGKWILIVVGLLFGVVAAVVTGLEQPRYVSRATVIIQTDTVRLSTFDLGTETDMRASFIETQLDIIESRELLGMLIDRLNLMEDPRINPFLGGEPQPLLRRLLGGSTSDDAPVPPPAAQREVVLNTLGTMIEAARSGESLALSISAQSADPNLSADLANTLADAYIDHLLENKRGTAQEGVDILRSRAEQSSQRIAEMEQQLATFIDSQKLDDENRGERLRAELEQVQALLNVAREQLPETHVRISELDAQMRSLRNQIRERTLASIRRGQLERELQSEVARYNDIIERASGLETRLDAIEPGAMLLSRATPPLASPAASPVSMGIFGAAGGFLLAAVFLVFRMASDTSIRNPEQVEAALNAPCLSLLPEIVPRKHEQNMTPFEIFRERPSSIFSEAVRRLLLNIAPPGRPNAPRIVAVGSALPDAGKSLLSLCLGVSASSQFARVAVVDFDIRRHGLSNIIRFDPRLSTHNGRDTCWNTCPRITSLEPLITRHEDLVKVDIFCAARNRRDVDRSLDRQRLETFFKLLSENYDFVIVDSPPIELVSDMTRLAGFVDGALLVVGWGETNEDMLKSLRKTLAFSNIAIIGAALNRIRSTGGPRYYERYFSKYMSTYYD